MKDKAQQTAEKLIGLANELGAEHALRFEIAEIVFDPRSLLKCMFGCSDWGKGNTCPSRPGSLTPWQYRRIFRRYRWGILVHCTDKKLSQDISFELERRAFLDGYHFALSLSDCAICRQCAGHRHEDCANPRKARPALQAVGIDVFETVHRLGLPLETLKDRDEPQNWYSAVFVE